MAYQIEFITDSRDGKGKRKDLLIMDRKLKKSGVKILKQGSPDCMTFENGKIKQCRKKYVIGKKQGEIWNDVFSKVNKIYAPKYRRV